VSAAAAARGAQPLWSLVPVSARAQYIRRAAVAMLDELDDLSRRLAEETGRPREQIVVSELLPAARGLRELADDGPRALADKRIWSVAGRRTRLVPAPVGVIGLRGPSASPWAEPALETAAALLAGNGVLLDLPAHRLRNVFLRAGVPGELVALSGAFDDARVIDLRRPDRRATLLVLNDAPRAKVIDAALRTRFTAGRIVTVAGNAAWLTEALPGPEFVVVEMPDAESAIALVAREARDVAVSVWAQDHAEGERVARRLPSPTTWIGRHGDAPAPAEVRLARHVAVRRLESRAAWSPEPSRLSTSARTALAELRYGRESRRWPALRALVRTARRER
jgi:acyl-CoA reductase-like NAD-dependent aldehyde dehydrogenase